MADKVPGTHPIKPGFAIASFGFVSMYLFRTGNGAIIAFDTGMRPAGAVAELAKLEIEPADVKHVFLTHSDTDHTGGLPAFPDAEVYFPEAEVPMVTRKIPRMLGLIYNKPPSREYRTVTDGEEVTIDGTVVRCISTPGHTSGSMSFFVDGAILITGDELSLKNGRAVLDRRIIALDNCRRLESIRKLAQLRSVAYLCTMHSGYTDDFDAAMEPWRDRTG